MEQPKELLTFDEYSRRAQATALYPGAQDGTTPALMYVGLKLTGESGELAGHLCLADIVLKINASAGRFAEHVGKSLRDDGLLPSSILSYDLRAFRREALLKELGDILWYLSEGARQLDSSLAEVAGANLDKVESRRERGATHGEGDNR